MTCKKDYGDSFGDGDADGDGDPEELYFDASRDLALPGWKNVKCVPGEYPSFKEPACNCLGDTHIDPEKSLQESGRLILRFSYSSLYHMAGQILLTKVDLNVFQEPGAV